MSNMQPMVQADIKPGSVQLIPSLPTSNPRYQRGVPSRKSSKIGMKAIPRSHRSARLVSGPEPPQNWDEYVHPEGDKYWYNYRERIATSINPCIPRNLELIFAALQALHREWVPEEEFVNFDVMFFLMNDYTQPQVHYCLIDHVTRQPFWTREVKLAELALDDSFESIGVIKSLLTSEYWGFVEYFPNHQGLPETVSKELTAILAQGCIDNMTSPGSTCPYGTEECMQYLKVLSYFKYPPSEEENPYQTLCIARLWGMITRVRHINSYGLSHPRLDRLQGLQEYLQTQMRPSAIMWLGESFTLWMSRSTFFKLTALWNGRVVYQRHWHNLFKELARDWMWMALLSIVILICDVVLFAFGSAQPMAMGSASLAVCSIGIALWLLNKHTSDRLATASDISQYIVRVEDYYHGLRPLSISFTLPRALTMYSAVLFFVSLFYYGIGAHQDLSDILHMVAAWSLPCSITLLCFTLYGSSRM